MSVVEEMLDALAHCRSWPLRSRRSRAESERLNLRVATHAQASEKSAKAPRVMITDKLNSYSAVRKDMELRIERRQYKGLNNRAEHSHLPTRHREQIRRQIKSPIGMSCVIVDGGECNLLRTAASLRAGRHQGKRERSP
jgi:DDE domain